MREVPRGIETHDAQSGNNDDLRSSRLSREATTSTSLYLRRNNKTETLRSQDHFPRDSNETHNKRHALCSAITTKHTSNTQTRPMQQLNNETNQQHAFPSTKTKHTGNTSARTYVATRPHAHVQASTYAHTHERTNTQYSRRYTRKSRVHT